MADKYVSPWIAYAERYEKLYWEPGKPTKNELKIFSNFVKKALAGKKNFKALVLGSTPGVRDTLANFKVDVTLIDINKEMMQAMDRLVTHHKKETKVEGNWLAMPFPDASFDLVIDDLALGNITAEHEEEFLKEVNRVLKPKGSWITRIFFVPNKWSFESTDKVLENFSKLDESYDRSGEIHATLNYNTYDSKKHEVDMSKMKKALSKYWNGEKYLYPKSAKVERWLNGMYQMWKPMEKAWRCGTKKELFSWIGRHFKILNEDYDRGHLFGYCYPVIFCQKK